MQSMSFGLVRDWSFSCVCLSYTTCSSLSPLRKFTSSLTFTAALPTLDLKLIYFVLYSYTLPPV
jgi:hypothetical protein